MKLFCYTALIEANKNSTLGEKEPSSHIHSSSELPFYNIVVLHVYESSSSSSSINRRNKLIRHE